MFLGYCLFLMASLIVTGHPVLQWICIAIWTVGHVGWISTHALPSQSLAQWMGKSALGQWPGIAAIVAYGLQIYVHHAAAWGDGVLELWVHPLMPLVERVPARTWWHHSDAFWVASAIPLFIIGMTSAYGWWLSHRRVLTRAQ